MKNIKHRLSILLIILMITMVGCAPSNITQGGNTAGGGVKIHFIDVGQADSILIQQGSSSMLIDAGNNGDSKLVTDYISNQGIKKLDYVIGTHPHEDHIGGLDKVIDSFDIGKIYMPRVSSTTATFKDVLTSIKNKNLKVTTPVSGDVFKLGEAEVTILAPIKSEYEDTNNNSIVMKVVYGSTSFLFMGDAETLVEKEIMSKSFDIKADVLKLGHHGSSTSTSQEFLDRVSPKYGVVSVGKDNTYNHPHKAAMDRLKAKGVAVYRTDEAGTIIATSDGKSISFNVKPGSYTYGDGGTSQSSSQTKEVATTSTTGGTNTITTTTAPKLPPSTAEPVKDKGVYYVKGSGVYHYDKNCKKLAGSGDIIQVSMQYALNHGIEEPCEICVTR